MATTTKISAAGAAIEILENARKAVGELLREHHDFIGIRVNAQLTNMVNQLRVLDGQNPHVDTAHEFKLKPATEFMGDPIDQVKPITQEQLSPRQLEIKNLNEKADRLQEALSTLTNEQILESYKVDKAPVRVVAKRAGLDDFKSAEITDEYLNKIRSGFDDAAKLEAMRQEEEDKLAK